MEIEMLPAVLPELWIKQDKQDTNQYQTNMKVSECMQHLIIAKLKKCIQLLEFGTNYNTTYLRGNLGSVTLNLLLNDAQYLIRNSFWATSSDSEDIKFIAWVSTETRFITPCRLQMITLQILLKYLSILHVLLSCSSSPMPSMLN